MSSRRPIRGLTCTMPAPIKMLTATMALPPGDRRTVGISGIGSLCKPVVWRTTDVSPQGHDARIKEQDRHDETALHDNLCGH